MAINFPATPNDGDTHEGYVWVAAESAWRRLPETPAMDIENLNNVSVTTPADGESLVYDSATGEWINADATVEVYDVDTLSTGYFMMPVGTEAQRPVNPANGYFRFNSDTGQPEWYSENSSSWVAFKDGPTFELQYLVIAGGGSAAGAGWAGAGGAGGYRSSVIGENSGGGLSAESTLSLQTGTYNVTVGAGGAVPGGGEKGSNGSNSVFATITSIGGGGGGSDTGGDEGKSGGSGGGGALDGDGGAGTVGQGFAGGGGSRFIGSGGLATGGGGGAGAAGLDTSSDGIGANGGDGVQSSITGTPTYRAGGGGGAGYYGGGSGGLGGGGNGALTNGTAGAANTGSGGGGADYTPQGSGGSGIVILKYPSIYSITPSAGVSSITSTVGDYKVTQITAGTGTVTFS